MTLLTFYPVPMVRMPMYSFSRIYRGFFLVLFLAAFLLPNKTSAQTVPLFSQEQLAPYGLNRVWYYQLESLSSQGHIQEVFLEGGQFFITTSDAKLHVLDSETGQWLWSRSIGDRSSILTEPAVNSRIVAVHNNLEIFLFNRKTGKLLMQIPLPDAAAAACELSEHYLYVPMINQTILAYVLRESHLPESEDDALEAVKWQVQQEKDDPELAKIVQQFTEAKRMIEKEAGRSEPADTFALDSSHKIPLTMPTQGGVGIKPLLLSQFFHWKLDDPERVTPMDARTRPDLVYEEPAKPTHEVDEETHREFVTWVTDGGFLYTAKITELSEIGMSMNFRVDSAGQTFYVDQTRSVQIDRPDSKGMVARPAQSQIYPVNEWESDKIIASDIIVAGGRRAYLFAVESRTGNSLWQYPTRGQLLEPIAIIGRTVYAPTSNNTLYALELETGKEIWVANNVKKFVAASKERLYVLDQRNWLVCLDKTSGRKVFSFDARRFDRFYFNVDTDQIFAITKDGLIQCLRERQYVTLRDATPDGREQAADSQNLVSNGDTSLRHRITASEFVQATKTGESPKFWWLAELEEDEQN